MGYFGDGSINYKSFKEVAEDFAQLIGVDVNTVYIDEINRSSRYKGFKYIFSHAENQKPLPYSQEIDSINVLFQ